MDLHHGSIETARKKVDASLTAAVNADANLMAAIVLAWEAKAIGGESCGCEGEEAKYGTLGANPVVL